MNASPRALLIEDEALPRQRLREGLAALWPQLQLVAEAEAEDGARGLALVLQHRPEIVFVDIRLPGLDGLQLAQRIKGLAHVVFVTAYDAHALAAFEQGAVDYLLKPLSTERLRETVQRLQQRLQWPPAELARWLQQWQPPRLAPAVAPAPLRWLQASQGERLHLVMVADVSHFRSDSKYTCAVTAEGEFLLRLSLRELLAQLDPEQFWQVHRAIVVNLAQVARVERRLGAMEVLLKDGATRLPVSQTFQPRFKPM